MQLHRLSQTFTGSILDLFISRIEASLSINIYQWKDKVKYEPTILRQREINLYFFLALAALQWSAHLHMTVVIFNESW